MKFATVFSSLAVLASFAPTQAVHLTADNFDSLSSGKTLFLKFYAPWCGHCKALAPDWDKLTAAFEGSEHGLVAEVDCTAEPGGPALCAESGVQGYPTLKWGSAGELEAYEGGRDFASLKAFAEANLKPQCSPSNLDLCDASTKAAIKALQSLSAEELNSKIQEKEQLIVDANDKLQEGIDALTATYQEMMASKDVNIAELRVSSGLSTMKVVRASRMPKPVRAAVSSPLVPAFARNLLNSILAPTVDTKTYVTPVRTFAGYATSEAKGGKGFGASPVTQFHQIFPALGGLYSDFEKNYDAMVVHEWSIRTWPHVPLALCFLYVVLVFGGKSFMKSRTAYGEWTKVKGGKSIPPESDANRNILAAWNLLLAVFSFVGATRTVPVLLHRLATLPMSQNICQGPEESWGAFATGFWVQLFIFSKPFELIDTYFIVVRKKPLIFLHWYHHVTVLLYCWHSYSTEASTGIFFVAMNYSVHAIMYFYYYLQATQGFMKRFKKGFIPPIMITFMQISQMVVGVTVCVASYYYKYLWEFGGESKGLGKECVVTEDNLLYGGLMYFSYMLLFVNFALERYGGQPYKNFVMMFKFGTGDSEAGGMSRENSSNDLASKAVAAQAPAKAPSSPGGAKAPSSPGGSKKGSKKD